MCTGSNSVNIGEQSLRGKLLLAMPGMSDERFVRSVVYICSHDEQGAMGLVINQSQDIGFPDILAQIGVIKEQQFNQLPTEAEAIIVRNGGPLDRGRGFVLHSDDVQVESSMHLSAEICLTATIDILRAISLGRGPQKTMLALGYSGWGPGQLEDELGENGWLTADATSDDIFTADLSHIYDNVMGRLGINLAHLSDTVGHG